MDEKNNFAPVPKPSGAVEKSAPDAKRILAGMVVDPLAVADAQLESWCKKRRKTFLWNGCTSKLFGSCEVVSHGW